MNFYKKLLISAIFSVTLSLLGCGGDSQNINLDSSKPNAEQAATTQGSVIFDPLTSNIPYPNDLLFAGSKDGTLNIPLANAANLADPNYALNELDGFSTSTPISVAVSKTVDVSTVANAVKVYQVTTSAQKAVTGVIKTLVAGVDYQATAAGKTLLILPLKPLAAKSSYLVAVTNDLKDSDGLNIGRGATYGYVSSPKALVDGKGKSTVAGLPDASAVSLEPIRQLTQAQLAATDGAGLNRNAVVLTWSFSTQSIDDVLTTVTTGVTNSSLALADSGFTTNTFATGGTTKLYSGSIRVPYYQTAPTAANPSLPLTSKWQGQTGGILTRYSVLAGDTPKITAHVTIPVLASVPTTAMPAAGWPVVIVQHGITQSRGNLIMVADALAAKGYVGIAIDLPLHGVTPQSSLASLRNTQVLERTFDLKLLSKTDALDESGDHFVQVTNLLTIRDNMSQAISDLTQLKAALGSATGLTLDANNVSFVGHSLGGIVGAGFVKLTPDLKASVIAMSGLQASYIFKRLAPFTPNIVKTLNEQGIKVGSAEFDRLFLAGQMVMDSVDPVNRITDTSVPTLLFEVVGDGNPGSGDQVVPNTFADTRIGGTEPWARLQGLNTLTDSGAVPAAKGVIRFTQGDHATIIEPGSGLTKQTMQEAMASFIATQGGSILVSDRSTIKQD